MVQRLLKIKYLFTEVPCRNGCCQEAMNQEMLLHEDFCHKRETPCPGLFTKGCDWSGTLLDMYKRLQEKRCATLGINCWIQSRKMDTIFAQPSTMMLKNLSSKKEAPPCSNLSYGTYSNLFFANLAWTIYKYYYILFFTG